MPPPFKNLVELSQHFSNEHMCMLELEERRWKGTPLCPHCGSEHHTRTKTRLKHPQLKDYKDFRCKACQKKYSVLTGTIFQNSKIPLRLWFSAMYLMAAHKKGISSLQLSRDLGVTQKTAWFMLHRIRALMLQRSKPKLEGVVSADETYVGGKNNNKHLDKRTPHAHGRSTKDKAPVVGMMEKDGSVRTFVVEHTGGRLIRPLILMNVESKSILVTDDYRGYRLLEKHYQRFVVYHKKKKYRTKEGYSTNNIENFWSLLKRGINGIYHQVSRKHLQRYCWEFEYRFNKRKIPDLEKFFDVFNSCNDLNLSYKELISVSIKVTS